ncbi:hypothetical protein ILUMI_21236 [Ignelater luminosus]|uniref:Major facilitator superfamily (MFS) profile domain-containing protein n=1 Tax=Ignelater luminosus TaxID=2038154 RepID=A0A8K0CEZ6_IGNLU|nr:hypothetical protein ILUMI_21236 [Ignelater luminosus]
MTELKSWSKYPGIFAQILATISGTLAAVSAGMQYGWTAPVIPLLQSEDTPVLIHESDIIWLENMYMYSAFIGLPFTIFSCNKFGGKKAILISSCQNLIAWLLTAFAVNIEMLYVARFITGFASNVIFISAPMYIGEIADEKIRGFLGSFIHVLMQVGIIVIYAVAPFVSLMASSLVGACFLIVHLITFPFMPESPYYLLLIGKIDEALKSLQRLRARNDVEEEFKEISAAVERQKEERGKIIDLFIVESNRKAFIIMSILNAAQQFSCVAVMAMNIHTILGDAASVLPPSTVAIIFSIIMLIATIVSACLVDKVGRRILLSSSSLLTGLSILILASYFAVKNARMDISSCTWIPVFAMIMYAASFKYGLGMVPIVMTGELFPTSVKGMGMTFADGVYIICSAISIYVYKYLSEGFGTHVPFFIFACSGLLTALFVIFYIPETKGKTLEEIQIMLKKNEQIGL